MSSKKILGRHPDPSKVFNYILHSNGAGKMQLSNLVKHPSPLQKFSESSALEWLNDHNKNIEQFKGDKKISAENRGFIIEEKDGITWVRVLLNIRLCQAYGSNNGCCWYKEKCLFWHVCKEFLEGNCTDCSKCQLSHNFLDEHNKDLTLRLGLANLTPLNILKVAVQNFPVVCQRYVHNECKDSCCQSVHLCQQYIKNGGRNIVKRCKRSHDLQSPHNRRVLKNFCLPDNEKYLFYHILLPKQVENKEASKKVLEKFTKKAEVLKVEKSISMENPTIIASKDISIDNSKDPPENLHSLSVRNVEEIKGESIVCSATLSKVHIDNKNIDETTKDSASFERKQSIESSAEIDKTGQHDDSNESSSFPELQRNEASCDDSLDESESTLNISQEFFPKFNDLSASESQPTKLNLAVTEPESKTNPMTRQDVEPEADNTDRVEEQEESTPIIVEDPTFTYELETSPNSKARQRAQTETNGRNEYLQSGHSVNIEAHNDRNYDLSQCFYECSWCTYKLILCVLEFIICFFRLLKALTVLTVALAQKFRR